MSNSIYINFQKIIYLNNDLTEEEENYNIEIHDSYNNLTIYIGDTKEDLEKFKNLNILLDFIKEKDYEDKFFSYIIEKGYFYLNDKFIEMD